jgi:hypothetical protein
MTAPDANCTDVRVQDALSHLLQSQAGYGEFLPRAKGTLTSETSHLNVDNESRPPKRLRLDREDNGNLFQTEPIPPSTLPRTKLHQSAPRSFPHSIFSSFQEAAAMLSRAEDTGGTRDLKLSRGPGGGHNKNTSKLVRRGSNDHNYGPIASRGERRSSQHGAQLLPHVGILELLQQDERPTFIVDLGGGDDTMNSRLNLLFANPALRAQSAALESIEGKSDDLTLIFATSTPHRDFKSWVLNSPDTRGASERSTTTFIFAGFNWRFFTIRGCLRIVHGSTDTANVVVIEKNSGPNLQQLLGPGSSSPRGAREVRPEAASYFDSVVVQGDRIGTHGKMSVLYQDSSNGRSSESSRGQFSPEYGGSPISNGDMGISDILSSGTDSISSASSQKVVFPVKLSAKEVETMDANVPSEPGFFDWTRLPVTPALPLHIQFARSIDWGATSLGRSMSVFGLYEYQILLIQS